MERSEMNQSVDENFNIDFLSFSGGLRGRQRKFENRQTFVVFRECNTGPGYVLGRIKF
jgi:hypothetical protein